MKPGSLLFVFILFFGFSFHAHSQWVSIGARAHFFNGLAGEVFKPAPGIGINFCFDSYDLDQFEFTGIAGISISFVQPVQDTFPMEAYLNDTLIQNSWERYYRINLYCIDLDFVWALSIGEIIKPFGGFVCQIPYIEYNYEKNVPGVISYSGTNEFFAGIGLGPVLGTWIFVNENFGLILRAEQIWGLVFTEGQSGFVYNAFDLSLGLMINFE